MLLDWGTGFSGVSVRLKRHDSSYRGTASTYNDISEASDEATAEMARIPCQELGL